jgi:hypothetical protein
MPVPPPFKTEVPDDGIDRELIRWALSLTPDQRLTVLQELTERHLKRAAAEGTESPFDKFPGVVLWQRKDFSGGE